MNILVKNHVTLTHSCKVMIC